MLQSRLTPLILILLASLARCGLAADWPMWGYDAARTGVSPDSLPADLHLRWTLKLRPPAPAWHATEEKLQFDRLYEPIVADKRMFIGSMTSDRMTAYDSDSGRELWRFYADGPIRFAPAVSRGKVYFVSDDGFLYCLRSEDGTLVWKFKGGPSARKVLGNERFIDIYPARGAPVIYGDQVYFAASIWPLMGVFVHALDAETGNLIWTNSGTGSLYIPQQHDAPAFAGITPQGYLAATEDLLLVAGGQTVPAAFDRHTGELRHFNLHSRRMGSKGGGGYRVRVAEDFFVNRGDMYRLSDGKFLVKAYDPLLPAGAILGVDPEGKLFRYERGTRTKPNDDEQGPGEVVSALQMQWTVATTPALEKLLMMAGSRAYGATAAGDVVAVDFSGENGQPTVAWTVPIEGIPLNMVAADQKLFVSTDRGEVLCFSGDPPATGTPIVVTELDAAALPPSSQPQASSRPDPSTAYAQSVLQVAGTKRGYCLLLGIGSGRLLDELVSQSELHIVALDPDAQLVARTRQKYDDRNLSGSRVEVLAGDIHSIQVPPYLARLIVSEDLAAAGLERGPQFCERVFASLRPYGGVACFALSAEQHESFANNVAAAQLARAEIGRETGVSILRRVGALPGSGDWTHHNGDAGNTVSSRDELVRAPLGILWFGGPSNEEVLPRHGHGPAPQVVGGRLFIEGPDMLRAVDVYTGLLLWERAFPGLGRPYSSTDHAPGAGAIGGNYVSVDDAVYVIYGTECHDLDPATGVTRARYSIPPAEGETEAPAWGFLAVLDDVLIGGVEPYDRTSPAFTNYEMRRYYGDRAKPLREALRALQQFDFRELGSAERESAYLVEQFNRLLFSSELLAQVPPAVRKKANVRELERELETYLSGGHDRHARPRALELKRQLLEAYYPLPKYRAPPIGSFGNSSRTASKRLVGLDRRTGKLLWQCTAHETFRHNAIAAGNGKVFALDRLPAAELDFLSRRGTPPTERRRIIALDLNTGAERWHTTERVFGTWLGYSAEYDVLLQAGSASGDRALDEVAQGMVAYQGASGDVLWQNDLRYSGPCMLLHDQVLTQVEPGISLNLLTGEPMTRRHPLTEQETAWSYSRNRGCNTAIASEYLITFRSSAAGFYDLAGDSGTGNLGGFRSGCTANLIPADGVLSAPDYTRTCTCSFQNRTSLALIHMPDVHMWTFNRYPWRGERVRRLGLNFGAPGDRRGPDGTLWLDYPSVGGDSPDVPVTVEGNDISWFRHHPTRITDGELAWVACSGVEGCTSIAITLAKESAIATRPYTVRLVFAEVEQAKPAERVFDVLLQGQQVLSGFDIAGGAGAANRSVIKEFRGIQAGQELRIDLLPTTGRTLISGVEVRAETK